MHASQALQATASTRSHGRGTICARGELQTVVSRRRPGIEFRRRPGSRSTMTAPRSDAQPQGRAIRALALDLDGTLLTSDKRVSEDSLATLRALLARNLKIVVVTGKAPRLSGRCLSPLDLPMVCLDGAVHVEGGVERWVPATTIGTSLVGKLLAASDAPCYVLANGTTLVRGALEEPQFSDWSDRVLPLTSARHLQRVTHVVFPNHDRGKLNTLARQVQQLVRRLGCAELGIHVTDQPFFGRYSLFVRRAGCTKLRGMQSLARRMRFSIGEIMFIGDWVNDIPLLREVGFPVAMRHAPPAVSSCARVMTLFGNDDEGVGRFLRAYFAIVGDARAAVAAPSARKHGRCTPPDR